MARARPCARRLGDTCGCCGGLVTMQRWRMVGACTRNPYCASLHSFHFVSYAICVEARSRLICDHGRAKPLLATEGRRG